jgi:DNA (cytosine-5)-methyltransferase 1
MAAWYNEIDPYAAQWLRNLIADGQIAPGDVDERSIADVQPGDVAGYDQCHFFAGIGGWSVALRLAGWNDERPVWTGSCPCQPFSAAGKRQGGADQRHLWPHWLRLIRECKPAILFGEQVEAAIGWGWLDAVFADLEAEGYATGAAVLPACGVDSPHIRQRVWFVGDASSPGLPLRECRELQIPGRWSEGRTIEQPGRSFWSDCDWLPCTDGKARPVEPGSFPLAHGVQRRAPKLRAYGNAIVPQVAAEFIASLGATHDPRDADPPQRAIADAGR